jgi:hypothetical protein
VREREPRVSGIKLKSQAVVKELTAKVMALLEEARVRYLELEGPLSLNASDTCILIGDFLLSSERPEESKKHYDSALKIIRQLDSPQHVRFGTVLAGLAHVIAMFETDTAVRISVRVKSRVDLVLGLWLALEIDIIISVDCNSKLNPNLNRNPNPDSSNLFHYLSKFCQWTTQLLWGLA